MIAPADLERWSQALLEASGLESAAAQTVAVSLVHANRRGTDSHGVARLPIYSQRLRDGHMNRNPAPKVEREDGAVALVDGDQGPGQVAGVFATDLSIDLARRYGAGVVVAHRSSHYGAAGYYAIRAAEAGMVGMSTTNSEPYVVPYGGIGHALGTNPIALAAPLPDGIWDTDMATSQVAVNKIFNARDEGRTIPEGWGVDSEGRTTTDPNEVYAAVPLGGYKGYALAVLVEVLSGVLSGSGVGHGIGRLYEDAAPAGRRALPPRDRHRPARGPRARRRAARPPARRPQGDPARAGSRRGPGARRAGAARAGGARARRHPSAAHAAGVARGAQRGARRDCTGVRVSASGTESRIYC